MRELDEIDGKGKNSALLTWTPEALNTFGHLKRELYTAPELASPEYNKPFHLYVSEHMVWPHGVLTKQQGPSKQ